MPRGKAENLLRSFYRISGMEISLCDRDFHGLASHRHSGENFCALIHRCSACLGMCHASDEEWRTKARSYGTSVRYTCPFGIEGAILPILSDDRVEGHIFCSMGILSQKGANEAILSRVLAVAPNLQKGALQTAIAAMPHLDGEAMDAYFSMLQLLADAIGSDGMLLDHTPTLGELAKRYIRENLSHKITLADLAWHLHCSTVTLTQHFKEEFGCSVMKYVQGKRMELAQQLLQNSEKTVWEIASLCGYADVEYFSRSFKNAFGLPPGRWRSGQTV